MTTIEKITKYDLFPYYENNKIKLAYNKVSMTLVYRALRFAKENKQIVKETYTGDRYVIITLR